MDPEDANALLMRLQFETSVLKAALASAPDSVQPIARALIQTGDHFLRPRYRLLNLGGVKIRVSDDFDVDEYVSALDAAQTSIQEENGLDERAKASLKWLRDEVENTRTAWFEIVSAVFANCVQYIRLPIDALEGTLQELVKMDVINKEDEGEILKQLKDAETFTTREIFEELKEKLRVTSNGKVLTIRVLGGFRYAKMNEAGFYFVPVEKQPFKWTESEKKALCCGPEYFQCDVRDDEESENETVDVAKEIRKLSFYSANALTLTALEESVEPSEVEDYPEIDLPEEEKEPTAEATKECKSQCNLVLSRFLQTMQSTSTDVLVPLDQLMEIFDNVSCAGAYSQEELERAKKEVREAAKETVVPPGPPIMAIPLEAVLDVFTRVLGVKIPKSDRPDS